MKSRELIRQDIQRYLCDDNLKTIIFEGARESREECFNNEQYSIHCFSNSNLHRHHSLIVEALIE